jgi:hypothetical protein
MRELDADEVNLVTGGYAYAPRFNCGCGSRFKQHVPKHWRLPPGYDPSIPGGGILELPQRYRMA